MSILPFGRPAHTLLYITENKTYRVNTNHKGIVIGTIETYEINCDSDGSLPFCLETLSKQSEKLGKKVWIFYIGLNTYTLSLPSIQVEGIADEFLEQALQFEYEALTGHSAMKSQLAFQFMGEVDEMSHFWITIIAKNTLSKLLQLLKKAGSQLGGVVHPGGLPKLLSSADKSTWLRIECWSTNIFAMSYDPANELNLQIFQHDSEGHWHIELEQWLLEIGKVEQSEAIMSKVIEYLPETEKVYHFTDSDDLQYWLSWWSKHLTDKSNDDIPLLKQEKKINKELVYMVAMGTTAFFLCSGHFVWHLYQQNDFEYQFEQLQGAEKDIKAFRKTVTTNKQEISTLKKQLKDIGGNITIIPYALASLQKRPAELLYRLSIGNPGDLIIDTFTTEKDQVIISGAALLSKLPNELAENVEKYFNEVSWQVNTPTKKDMLAFAQGGPWAFDIILKDQGIRGFTKQ